MYEGPIIDVDLHHRWHSEADLIAYLPQEWREAVDRSRSTMLLETPGGIYTHATGSNKRNDAWPPTGGPPGSHYDTMCDQWLDPYPVAAGVLSFDIGAVGGIPNPLLASALCRAANDWSIDQWIEKHEDSRLYTGALVPTQIPEDGAAEIHRMAAHARVAEALVVSNGLGKPFGHPAYHPIYAAAEECGLPIVIHIGGDNWTGPTQGTAGGMPLSRFEAHTVWPLGGVVHLTSFVVHGVFEKYPKLKLVMLETGVAWLPWLLWSLDRNYDSLRRESPHVKRLPSEYLREHVRISTQPFEITPHKQQLIEAFEAAGGIEDMLVFSSDYPHWDTDEPGYIARRIPKEWWDKVFYENAADVLRFVDGPPEVPEHAKPAGAEVG